MLWDVMVYCDRYIEHRRPDMVVLLKNEKRAFVVDFAVPGDGRVIEKEREKKARYAYLADELSKMWSVKVTVIPIVVGCLGGVSSQLSKSLHLLSCECPVFLLQKAALLGSCRILRHVLSL